MTASSGQPCIRWSPAVEENAAIAHATYRTVDVHQSYIVTRSVPPSHTGEWVAEAKRRRKDGTRFRGSDNDAGTAGPDSECSCETG